MYEGNITKWKEQDINDCVLQWKTSDCKPTLGTWNTDISLLQVCTIITKISCSGLIQAKKRNLLRLNAWRIFQNLVKKRWKGTPLLSYWRIAGSNSHHAWAKQNFPWGSRGSVNVVPDIKDSIGSHPLPNWRDLRASRKQKPETDTC